LVPSRWVFSPNSPASEPIGFAHITNTLAGRFVRHWRTEGGWNFPEHNERSKVGSRNFQPPELLLVGWGATTPLGASIPDAPPCKYVCYNTIGVNLKIIVRLMNSLLASKS
jgi:hypothetical protein